MTTARVGEVSIAYETDGPADGIPMLLLMGLGGQLVMWPQGFVDLLAAQGFWVVRMDNRDIGLSSRTKHSPLPRFRDLAKGYLHPRLARADYLLADMARDAAGLLDHLGVAAAHVVGMSMGGMIAQQLAIDHPDRVLSLCSVMSTTGRRRHGASSPRLLPAFVRQLRAPVPASREDALVAAVEGFRLIAGPGFEPAAVRQLIELAAERDTDQRGTQRQVLAILASPDRTPGLRRVRVPTLVVHGLQDRLVLPSGGLATARAVPGSRLLMFPDMGHDLPPSRWEEIVEAVTRNAARADIPAPTGEDGPMSTHLWIRSETRPTERRAPVVPGDVASLVAAGLSVTVETSPTRAFADADYAAAGARLAPAGSWVDAPAGTFVLGVKELPDEPALLRHDHIYFAHAFKGQSDAAETLGRFERGGGSLYDIEYLVDEDDRRVVAFGYWAGYVGASLGALHTLGALPVPLAPMTRPELDERVRAAVESAGRPVRALVTGALGRSGRGACDALAAAGIEPTRWDLAETHDLDTTALLGHDLLVHCVMTTVPTSPFVTDADLDGPRRLAVIADVTCDVSGPTNLLPVNTEVTSWERPARRLREAVGRSPAVDVIAVDNLPSLLPREASEAFSADLTPQLLDLARPDGPGLPWRAARAAYERARATLS